MLFIEMDDDMEGDGEEAVRSSPPRATPYI